MFYLDNGSGVETMPEPANRMSSVVRFFTEGDNLNAASYPGQDWFNIVQSELLNILKLANIDPNKATYNQLATAIQAAIDVVGNSAVRLVKNKDGNLVVDKETNFTYGLKSDGSDVLNTTTQHIVAHDELEDGSWWKEWNDGTVEQGGFSDSGADTTLINLLVPYSNTKYHLDVSSRGSSSDFSNGSVIGIMWAVRNSGAVADLTTTSFKAVGYHGFAWYARGKK